MRKRQIFILGILVSLSLAPLLMAEEVIHKTFDLEPKLAFEKKDVGGTKEQHRHREQLTGILALHNVTNQSFVLEVRGTIHHIGHYCPLVLGFRHAESGQATTIRLYRGDHMLGAKVEYRQNADAKPFAQEVDARGLGNGRVTFRFQYNQQAQRLDINLFGSEGEAIAHFHFDDVTKMALDAFIIQTLRLQDVGTVWYDPEARELFVQSVREDTFTAAMSIDELILTFEKR